MIDPGARGARSAPDIPYGRHCVEEDDINAVVEALRSPNLTQGPRVDDLERAIAEYVGARHAVAVSSGTAALHLACIAADLGPGDNVITSPNTFVASANCVRYVGAEPHFADIDGETLNLDPQALAHVGRKVSAKAMVPVHFGGVPCDMPAIQSIAHGHGAKVIEDACHALGADYASGGKVGNCKYSDMTVFSFHPVKVIAAGEGGMITTNDGSLYRRLLRLRSHGINKGDEPFRSPFDASEGGQVKPWYCEMDELGYNYRITDLQSALALSQFRKISRFLARRREIAAAYDRAFAGHPCVALTQVHGRALSAHHLYVVRIDFRNVGISRTEFLARLRAHGIRPQVHYIPVYMHPYYRRRGVDPAQFPETQRYYEEALSIPMYYELSPSEQDMVAGKIKDMLR